MILGIILFIGIIILAFYLESKCDNEEEKYEVKKQEIYTENSNKNTTTIKIMELKEELKSLNFKLTIITIILLLPYIILLLKIGTILDFLKKITN